MTDENTPTTTTDSRLEDIPWRRVANIAGILLLVAVVIPFVVFAVPQVVGADQGYVVLSGSMEPAMSPGDAVIVNDVPASEIEQNDVITFGGQGDGTPTTHRVIEVVERDGTTAFRTKGDANEDPDATLVTPDQVQGKVMSVGGHLLVIPFIGYVINFAGTQSGFVLFFALPVMLFVLNEIWNVVTAARSNSGGDPAETSAGSASDATATDAAAASAPEAPSTRPDGSGEPEATAQPGGAAAEASTEDDAEISFTAAELQLGLGVNAAFLAYSVWVVYSIWTTYDTVETWALGVVGGVGASFLLLGGLYVFGGGDSGGGDATDEAASAEPASDSEPDQAPLASSDEATAEQNGTTPSETQSPEVNADTPEIDADTSGDTATHRTNGDGQPASSVSDGGDPTADTDTGGTADE
jgi:signal peptidase I, archaeal type